MGHGWLSATIKLALDAGVKKLVLFHHDPTHDDDEMDAMAERGRALVAARVRSSKWRSPAKEPKRFCGPHRTGPDLFPALLAPRQGMT